ncbi:organic cation transporter-like protein [Drosophila grimshawi]|uniref:organic cation transporter-like protein n=1 Tax=Drosophila grimshawi TaxID=7222 RepID=UPI001C935F4D|nr:organic cation transporter-like protein [Drosophila grimshawi]
MGYDEIIVELGDFGRYQRIIYVLICLTSMPVAFHKLAGVFLLAKPKFRCALSNETNQSFELTEELSQLAYPPYEKCERYELEYDIGNESFHRLSNETQSCNRFIYDRSRYANSAVTEFDLVCGREFLAATSDSMFMLGVLLGSIIFGQLSDKLGRKPIFFASLVIQLVFGIAAGLAPDYFSYTLARLVVGATTSGVFLVAYVIAMEMVGPTKRLYAGIFVMMFFSVGYMLTAGFAYFIHDWRWLQIALTLPGLIFMGYYWIIPESVRWLLSKGKREEALDVMQKAARFNHVEISRETLERLLDGGGEREKENEKEQEKLNLNKQMELERNLEWKLEREQEEKHLKEQGKDQLKEQERRLQLEKEKQLNLDLNLKLKQKEHEQDQEDQVASAAKPASVWDLFHYPNLRRKTLVIFFDWLVCTGVYYGLSWSPNNLGGNVLLNFVISGAVEIPAYCFLLLTLNRWGRRSILCGCMLLAGISLLATILVPVKMQWLMITFAMLGKLAITGSYGTIYLFSSEQFPTVVRTVGMGAASMVSRLTGMLAPYLNALASIWRPLPLVIYGVLALSAGFLSLLLPETHNKPTLETIADGERFGRREKSSRRDLEKGRELETQPLNLSNGNKA